MRLRTSKHRLCLLRCVVVWCCGYRWFPWTKLLCPVAAWTVGTWVECLRTDKPYQCIANHHVNSAFIPSGVGNRAPACRTGVKVGRVYLRRLAGCCSVALSPRWVPMNTLCLPLGHKSKLASNLVQLGVRQCVQWTPAWRRLHEVLHWNTAPSPTRSSQPLHSPCVDSLAPVGYAT